MDKNTLVLDLDDVLLNDPKQYMSPMHTFFSKYTLIVSDQEENNYIFPAYIEEFMKYVADNFIVHFFSGGDKRRNEIVVEKLWQSVFHCAKPDHVRILSRDDKTFRYFENPPNTECYVPPERLADHGTQCDHMLWGGCSKKDITKLGPVEKTILVDDDCSYVLADQVKNFLQVNNYSFNTIFKMCENCTNKDSETYIKFETDFKERFTRNKNSYFTPKGEYMAFHKLLHTVGVLENAKLHQGGIVEGLANIFFIDDKSNHRNVRESLMFSKRGYDVLSKYATSDSYPKLECLENLILSD